ncbi:PDF receptor-like [Ruditapes philippinarum]|uniref:PDF receptor-like n=1 Tax=Ruditapes philippinarum TaxID=129788 RepID=UPI00295AD18A|nr:PDF receptor-like [Ruditapes philippinarum]
MEKITDCSKELFEHLEIVDIIDNSTTTWDTILCWPAARAGSTIRLPCPPLPGLDPEKFGYKTCGPEGLWEGKYPGDYSMPRGYTNYTDCYTPETLDLYKRFYSSKTAAQKQMMKDVINGTRTMDVVGLWLSLVSSLLSLFIFSYFRSLRCHRTRIHRNLFLAIIVQVFIRLIVYVDQFVARVQGGEIAGTASGMSGAIYDTPVLCEVLIALLEYTKTVQFMWMLIEGMYLHNQIAVSVFSKNPNYMIFYAMGWGSPLPVTIVWCIVMELSFKSKCWFPYYYSDYIWIIEVPRIGVIFVNLLFLLNILRVLVLKLQDSRHANEAQYVKVRKAIKAALFLLPLLGITNFVVMIESPTDAIAFAIWSYLSHFLVSFQGFLISLLYCFLNGEVQHTLRKRWGRCRQRRMVHNSSFRRFSRSFSVFTSVTEVPHSNNQVRGQASGQYNCNAAPLLRNIISRQGQESGV